VLAALFWICAVLIVYTHVGYPVLLWLFARLQRQPTVAPPHSIPGLPTVTLIVAAHDEEKVIAEKVANAKALDYPGEKLGIVVASDGSTDRTVELARDAGAHIVLDLPRSGKIAAQNAAAVGARGQILAFSDANSMWEPDALRRLVEPFADPHVGYVCGQVRYTDPEGDNLEGAYWGYELALRELESALGGVTAGNGAIYAVRSSAYVRLPTASSHDLSLPFRFAKRGLRALYAPTAVATEKMVPTLGGEFARKRRMMVGLWDIVIGGRMLSLRRYPPLFAFQLISHRLLRYLTPLLHLIVLVTNVLLLGDGAVYTVTLAAQLALLAGAAAARFVPWLPLRMARYYVTVTASIAAGLWDRLRKGSPGTWQKAEGTR